MRLVAINSADVGRAVAIQNGQLMIDGQPRAVMWEAGGLPPPADLCGTIVSVDENLGAPVQPEG